MAERECAGRDCTTKNLIRTNWLANSRIVSSSRRMVGMIELLLHWLASLVKSRRRLEAENLVLRHQVNILRRCASRRLSQSADRSSAWAASLLNRWWVVCITATLESSFQ